MILTLMGPDELGVWVLTDDSGTALPFVTSHEEHLNAALLGWERPNEIDDEDAIMNALDWLMDHTGEDFVAPKNVVEQFEDLYSEQD